MDTLTDCQNAQLARAEELIKKAEKDYILTSSTLQELSKDNILYLIHGDYANRYENYSSALMNHKHEIMKTTFPDCYRPVILQVIENLTKTSDQVISTIKLLKNEGDKRKLRNINKKILEAIEIPIFDGQAETDSPSWTEFYDQFNEYLETLDLRLNKISLEYLKRFFTGEPRMLINTFGNSTPPEECLEKMRKIYSPQHFIVKRILLLLKKIRIPHYHRSSWKQVEDGALKVRKLLMKIPNSSINFEILDQIERTLPLEKREYFLDGTKFGNPDQKLAFTLKLLEEIANFGCMMSKKPTKSSSWWNDNDTDDTDNEDDAGEENLDDFGEHYDHGEDVDITEFLEECDQAEREAMRDEEDFQEKTRKAEEDDRRALTQFSDMFI